jgi:MoaA/NifB/PqqE/SkfB family radical SAM enzyme
MIYKVINKENKKLFKSEKYNYMFDRENGTFIRWGKTLEDDPEYSQFGPEILDIEISTSVRDFELNNYDPERLVYDEGCKGSCSFCYKSNGRYPTYNMSFEEFKDILDKMPLTLTQIAFGILNYDTNPDFLRMAKYAKSKGIIPNFTMHGLDDLTDEQLKEIKNNFGAVAISLYNKDKTYNLIERLTNIGMKQVNIHYMISKETLKNAFSVIDDIKKDKRLKKINAIVFLSLKQKGGGVNFNRVSTEDYNKLVNYALEKKISFGFDSCGAHKFLNAVKNHKNYEAFKTMAEPCESSCFSSYINAKGEYYPCSFAEGHNNFGKTGQSVLEANSFFSIWDSKETKTFRNTLLSKNRNCPMYKI